MDRYRLYTKTVGLFLVFLFVAGCAHRMGDFKLMSAQDVDIKVMSKGSRVEGSHCVPMFFIPNPALGFDRAMAKAGSAYEALSDVKIDFEDKFFVTCFKVSGIPISTRATGANPGNVKK